jgi:hypothetical protein
MNTTITKLSIFVFMVPAMTTLMIGAATTFGASTTHTYHNIWQTGNDDSWTSSFTHSPYSTGTVGSDDLSSLGYSQYGSGSHQQHHNSSPNMIADINGDNSNSTAGSVEPGSFSSIEYAWNHPHHHHHHNSLTDMIADINGDNSNSTAGSVEPGSFSSIEYAWNHPHHHHNNMIVDIN